MLSRNEPLLLREALLDRVREYCSLEEDLIDRRPRDMHFLSVCLGLLVFAYPVAEKVCVHMCVFVSGGGIDFVCSCGFVVRDHE